MISLLKKTPDFIIDIFVILILAISTGFAVNYSGDNGISLDEKITEKKSHEQYNYVALEVAKEKFDSGQALFIDSRYEKYFLQAHIKDAVNIPADQKDDKAIEFIHSYPDKDRLIIIYCDGEECDLSPVVYNFLKELGYHNLNILVNGWSLWKEKHYPINQKNLNHLKVNMEAINDHAPVVHE